MTYKISVTQDQHMKACDWLEDHLEAKVFAFDVDDFRGMVEQVVWQTLKPRGGLNGV